MRRETAGFSLVEVLLAVVVLGVIATTIMGVVATVGRGRSEDEARLASAQAQDGLRAVLKQYTIAWPQSGEPTAQDLAALDTALVGVAGCSINCRALPGDPCPWALAVGCRHKASALLPPSLSAAPKSAVMTYDVVASSDGSRTALISITWNH